MFFSLSFSHAFFLPPFYIFYFVCPFLSILFPSVFYFLCVCPSILYSFLNILYVYPLVLYVCRSVLHVCSLIFVSLCFHAYSVLKGYCLFVFVCSVCLFVSGFCRILLHSYLLICFPPSICSVCFFPTYQSSQLCLTSTSDLLTHILCLPTKCLQAVGNVYIYSRRLYRYIPISVYPFYSCLQPASETDLEKGPPKIMKIF